MRSESLEFYFRPTVTLWGLIFFTHSHPMGQYVGQDENQALSAYRIGIEHLE